MSGCGVGGGEGGGGSLQLTPGTVAEQQQQPSPHVLSSVNEEDSQLLLEQMFAVIKQDNYRKGQPSWSTTRNLPESFNKPPARGSHSREGSKDSTNSGVGFPMNAAHPGLPVSHSRSQSEPIAMHTHQLSSPPQHAKQVSVDYTTDMAALQQQHWDINKNLPSQSSQIPRFLSQTNGQNWQPEAPSKSLSTTALNQQQQQLPAASPPQLVPRSTQSQPSQQIIGALPPGWEQGITADGEIYYINHVDKTTSWFDPRIPKSQQRPAQKMNQMLSSPGMGSQQTTRLPTHPPPHQPPQLSPNPQPVSTRRPVPNPNDQIGQELQRLQEEKRRLKREQEDVMLKEQMLKDLMTTGRSTPRAPQVAAQAPPPDLSQQVGSPMQDVSSSGVDPFLGQAQNTPSATESHARQNSSDSGLGGMGTSYSLSRTTEDILTNLEEMDSQDASTRLGSTQKPLGVAFGSELSGGAGMDIGVDPSECGSAMDSEDLMPSLQEDIGADLLRDLDVPNDNFTWL